MGDGLEALHDEIAKGHVWGDELETLAQDTTRELLARGMPNKEIVQTLQRAGLSPRGAKSLVREVAKGPKPPLTSAMGMMCPDCRSPLVAAGRNRVTCSAHAATFEVLFARTAVACSTSLRPNPPLPQAALPASLLAEAVVSEKPDRIIVECPSCGRRYKIKSGHVGAKASCMCGDHFVIEDHEPPPEMLPGRGPSAVAGKCIQHPNSDAAYACGRCRGFVCDTCAFPQMDGSILCPECATSPVGLDVSAPTEAMSLVPMDDGAVCIRHVKVPAIRRCSQCNAAVCATCDFAFAGGIHLCPSCATSPQTRLSGKQKAYVGWSLGLQSGLPLEPPRADRGFADSVNSKADEEALGVGLMLFVVVLH